MPYRNPYQPFSPSDDAHGRRSESRESVWTRNLKALLVVVVLYSMFGVGLTVFGRVLRADSLIAGLLVLSSLGSLWANLPLGTLIGWHQGGLPIVLVVSSIAIATYSVAAVFIFRLLAGMMGLR